MDQANFIKRYIEKCPLECNTVKYDFQISSLNYPAYETYIQLTTEKCDLTLITGVCYPPAIPNYPPFTYYAYLFKQYKIDFSTYDLYKDYFYSMKIFYAEPSYTQITEAPQQNLIDLYSSLGGNLGLFLGFSIFSLVELFELFIKIIWTMVSTRRKKH